MSISDKMIKVNSTLLSGLSAEMPVNMVKISWNAQKNPRKIYFQILLYSEKFPEIKKFLQKFPENWHLCKWCLVKFTPAPPPPKKDIFLYTEMSYFGLFWMYLHL